jgi:glycosyltransferase involved in cell wall biosynthesis
MKLLWVCNVIPLPTIADALGISPPVLGGWMTGFAKSLVRMDSVELSVCFPLQGTDRVVSGRSGGVRYFGFPQPKKWRLIDFSDQRATTPQLKRYMRHIMTEVNPDVLHIFGTEYGHALVAAEVFGKPERTLVNIQGLMSVYAQHYCGTLPRSVQRKWAVSNLLRGSISKQSKMLARSGELEVATLRASGHVIGRTDWDRACTARINQESTYHFCNESLRDEFYTGSWDVRACEKHSIFMGQSSSPVKGLYNMLEAMPEVLRRFADAHLYVAGVDPTRSDALYNRLKRSAYGKYLAELIERKNLGGSITFLGQLSEADMRDRFLRSHVFVSASTIENESNALSEAKLLGVPSVASFVGGVTSRLRHGVDGFAYQHDAPYMLAHYVCEVFERDDLAEGFSIEARTAASKLHDRDTNAARLISIYDAVLQDR